MSPRGGLRLFPLLVPVLLLAAAPTATAQTDWADTSAFLGPITAEVKAHCRTILADGQSKGRVAGRMGQIGDSITEAAPYFRNVVVWGPEVNETGHDYGPIRQWLGAGWYETYGKGSSYGNQSGWRLSYAMNDGHPERAVLTGSGGEPGNFSWVIIMFGTNDIDDPGWNGNAWIQSLRTFVQGYVDLGVIPVLSTIPPEAAHAGDGRVQTLNAAVLNLARSMKVPWIDFYAYVLHHHPTDWNGTLISSDGTHPSHGDGSYPAGQNFSQDGLIDSDGYSARSKLTFDFAEKLKRIVFENGAAEAPLPTERGSMGRLKTRFRGN